MPSFKGAIGLTLSTLRSTLKDPFWLYFENLENQNKTSGELEIRFSGDYGQIVELEIAFSGKHPDTENT